MISDGQRFIVKVRDFKNATGLNEGLGIKTSQAVSVVCAIVAVALLFWFLNRTRTGKSMRARIDFPVRVLFRNQNSKATATMAQTTETACDVLIPRPSFSPVAFLKSRTLTMKR